MVIFFHSFISALAFSSILDDRGLLSGGLGFDLNFFLPHQPDAFLFKLGSADQHLVVVQSVSDVSQLVGQVPRHDLWIAPHGSRQNVLDVLVERRRSCQKLGQRGGLVG